MGITTPPPFLNNHYPVYVVIGLSEDPEETVFNSEELKALIASFHEKIEGSVDLSNNATFKVVETTVTADQPVLEALVALSGYVRG
jgi:hypothetical protein